MTRKIQISVVGFLTLLVIGLTFYLSYLMLD